MTPPRGWERLLGWLLHPDDREAVLGDLEEERALRERAEGAAAARRWYRRQALRSAAPALLRRLRALDSDEEARMGRVLDDRMQDVRFTLRTVAARPLFAVVTVLTLALGVGSVTTLYSLVDGTLLEPLPFRDADELALLYTENEAEGQESYFVSPMDFGDWRARATAFGGMAAFWPTPVALTGLDGGAVRVDAAFVTENFLDVLGASTLVGRGFTGEDGPGSAVVAVLSHGLWQRRFGADPSLVGRAIEVDGAPVEVIGVLRRDQAFPADVGLWLNMTWPMSIQSRSARWMSALARRRPGASLEQARADMDAVAARLAEEHPADAGWGVEVADFRQTVVGDTGSVLWLLLGATGLVLAIACANVANLLLARSESRAGELAVRSALGAGRGRIAWQLLTESLVLAFLGGVAGVVLARVGLVLLRPLVADALPPWTRLELDGTVLAVALAATAVTGVLFGLAPVLRVLRGRIAGALRTEGRGEAGGGRLQGGFVVAQLALAVVVAVGAALLGRTFQELRAADTGFAAGGVLTFELDLGQDAFPGDRDVVAAYRAVAERLRSLPGVEGVGAASTLPLDEGLDYSQPVGIEGRPASGEEELRAFYRHVVPGFFETMRTPVVAGRTLEPADREDAPGVAVVNRAFARRYFPDGRAVGERLTDTGYRWGPLGAVLRDTLEVVGVVEDIRYEGVRAEAQPALYVSQWQAPMRRMTLTVRTDGDPAEAVDAVRAAVGGVDPDLPLSDLRTMESVLGGALSADRLGALVLSLFGVVALVLSAVGVYGVLAYGVARRIPEMGLRMALGADGGAVRRLVLARALRMAGAGVALGIGAAVGSAGLLRARLFGVAPRDPWILAGVAAVLVAVAVVAAWVPALRATRVDPLVALRGEATGGD